MSKAYLVTFAAADRVKHLTRFRSQNTFFPGIIYATGREGEKGSFPRKELSMLSPKCKSFYACFQALILLSLYKRVFVVASDSVGKNIPSERKVSARKLAEALRASDSDADDRIRNRSKVTAEIFLVSLMATRHINGLDEGLK